MKDFFNEDFAKNLGISDHEKFQIASEVSYMNEANKMYSLARVTKMHNGHIGWASDQDHYEQAVAQIEKIEPQERARNLSRLSFVDERIDADTGKVVRTVNDVGIRVLKGMNTEASAAHIKGRMKTHTVNAILGAENAEEALAKVDEKGKTWTSDALRGARVKIDEQPHVVLEGGH